MRGPSQPPHPEPNARHTIRTTDNDMTAEAGGQAYPILRTAVGAAALGGGGFFRATSQEFREISLSSLAPKTKDLNTSFRIYTILS